ncbi:MAG: molybdenum cofactor biosynthesis protein MoaB [Candidatus Lokiarchaeota archaeon]
MKVHESHKHKAPDKIIISVVVVSTSRYEELKKGEISSDKTIPIINDILSKHDNIILDSTHIVPDSEEKILEILKELTSQDNINSIIFSGGTGLSPKDITYETIEPLLRKKLPGFGELFRYLSYKEIGSSAILSRSTAGTYQGLFIFLLPGSPNAVKLALEKLIFPELGHIIYLLNKEE